MLIAKRQARIQLKHQKPKGKTSFYFISFYKLFYTNFCSFSKTKYSSFEIRKDSCSATYNYR